MVEAFALGIMRRRSLFAPKSRIRVRKPPKWLFPAAAELAYRAALLAFVDELATAIREDLITRLPALFRDANPLAPRADDWVQDLASIMAALRARLSRPADNAEDAANVVALDVSAFNRDQWRRIIHGALGIDVFTAEPNLAPIIAAFAKENASRIKSIPEKLLGEVEQLTFRGLRQGTRPEALANDIFARFDVTRARARLIARDQIGSLNGELTKVRQEALGVSRYKWRGALDERERPLHVEREGMIFSWDKPPSDGHPGQPINCRCYAEPVLEDILEGL